MFFSMFNTQYSVLSFLSFRTTGTLSRWRMMPSFATSGILIVKLTWSGLVKMLQRKSMLNLRYWILMSWALTPSCVNDTIVSCNKNDQIAFKLHLTKKHNVVQGEQLRRNTVLSFWFSSDCAFKGSWDRLIIPLFSLTRLTATSWRTDGMSLYWPKGDLWTWDVPWVTPALLWATPFPTKFLHKLSSGPKLATTQLVCTSCPRR